ncbi:MAG: dihydropteroate synthase [Actinobacteria bacterium]|nr:MAG: dihydropteroate synthase [Actinomycetota bacterium]
MGILNITPDSFSDAGKYFNQQKAINHALEMVNSGADIIDIGGESTRPGSVAVSLEEELQRVIPAIKAIKSSVDIPISIDTSKPQVAKQAIEAGVDMVNDVAGLRDRELMKVVAEANIPTCIMHMQGKPRVMQDNPKYDDVVGDIKKFLSMQAQSAIEAGLDSKNITIDPGIGFGKTLEHNLEILRRLKEFKDAGYPILIGPSRKSFIGAITGKEVEERVWGTQASVACAILGGADIIRVHDVAEMKEVATVTDAIIGKHTSG